MIKPSDLPVGTYILHDFDEYVKTNRHWDPKYYMSDGRTFSEMDYFFKRGDKIEILAVPWSVVNALIENIRDYQQNFISMYNMPSVDDILKDTIDEVAEGKGKKEETNGNVLHSDISE